MTRSLISTVALAALLSACGRSSTPPAAAPAAVAQGSSPSTPMKSGMPGTGPGNAGHGVAAQGSGRINAIDATAGTVTIDHGPIAAANWPAMVMTFHAPPAVLAGAHVGDTVAFEVTIRSGDGEVTAIRRQP